MRKASIVRHGFIKPLWHLWLVAEIQPGMTLTHFKVCATRGEAIARKRAFLKGV